MSHCHCHLKNFPNWATFYCFFKNSEFSRASLSASYIQVPAFISYVFALVQRFYRWLCSYRYIQLWLYHLVRILSSKRLSFGPPSNHRQLISLRGLRSYFVWSILMSSMKDCLLCDVVLGCDWFNFCPTAIPCATIALSDSAVLDFSLSPKACLRSQSGERFYVFSFLLYLKLHPEQSRFNSRLWCHWRWLGCHLFFTFMSWR